MANGNSTIKAKIVTNLKTLQAVAEDVDFQDGEGPQDLYIEGEFADAIALSVANAVADVLGAKINELIDEYNQLRLDVIAIPAATTAKAVSKIS